MVSSFYLSVAIKLELYLILALSLNLLLGFAGLVSLCHAAFYGVGAYTTALVMMRLGWSFLPALAAGVGVTMVLGALVALPSLRLRDDTFVVATLALQNIVYRVLYNADGLTRGALGLMDLPPARVGGLTIGRDTPAFLALATVVTLVALAVLGRLANSPFGRTLRALRDDDEALAALGRNVAAFKVKVFLVASAAAAVAGSLLAVHSDVLHPNEFTIEQSVLILTALIVGGAGNVLGPVIGAGAMVAMEEGLRLVGGRWSAFAGEANALLLALALIVLLRLRPQGLAGVYRFE